MLETASSSEQRLGDCNHSPDVILPGEIVRALQSARRHLSGNFSGQCRSAYRPRQEIRGKPREVKRSVSTDFAMYSQIGSNHRQSRCHSFDQWVSEGLHVSRCDVEMACLINVVQ